MIRKIEEFSINAFPTTETLYYDGWIVRMAAGQSKRINSVYSLYPSTLDLNEKIDYCEGLYEKRDLRKVFKLTNDSDESLKSILLNKGYEEAGRTSIQVLDLDKIDKDKMQAYEILDYFTEEWLEDYCICCNKTEDDKKSLRSAWQKVLVDHCFIAYKVEGKRIAFGMGAIQDGYIGIYSVSVNQAYRRQGYGRGIMEALLSYGKSKGCEKSYLQVEVSNEKANALYEKLGYKEIYQYYYLLKS